MTAKTGSTAPMRTSGRRNVMTPERAVKLPLPRTATGSLSDESICGLFPSGESLGQSCECTVAAPVHTDVPGISKDDRTGALTESFANRDRKGENGTPKDASANP